MPSTPSPLLICLHANALSPETILLLPPHASLSLPLSSHVRHCAMVRMLQIRLWDIRAQACVYTLPAHKSLISEVRYHRKRLLFPTLLNGVACLIASCVITTGWLPD